MFLKYHHLFDHIIINDSNEKLINCYIQIRDNLEKLTSILDILQKVYLTKGKENTFNQVKEKFNGNCSPLYSAAFFIFLNKTGFNGLYRVNRKGEYNVAFGHYVNPIIYDMKNLLEISSLLSKVEILNLDFRKLDIYANSFIYCDPPYFSVNGGFTSYGRDRFEWSDHVMLKEWILKSEEQEVRFAYSNSCFAEAKIWFNGYNIKEINVNRTLAQEAIDRFSDTEILIDNLDKPGNRLEVCNDNTNGNSI